MVFDDAIGKLGLIKNILAGMLWQERNYTASVNPQGRLTVNAGGFNIGYIVDAPYFENSWLEPEEIGIIARFEQDTQEILKNSKPRLYSGLHPYSHIYSDAKTAFGIAKNANSPLDFVTILAIIGHDSIEDRPRIKELMEQWESSIISKDNKRRAAIGEELKRERMLAREEIEKKLKEYASEAGIHGSRCDSLLTDINTAADIILRLTRFSDVYPYPISMGYEYRKIGDETLDRVLIRCFVKNCDRISNLREVGPMLPKKAMENLARAFENDSYIVDGRIVGKELRHNYGGVRNYGVKMPPSVLLGLAFNSFFPLQFQNETLNENGETLFYDEGRIRQLLKLAEYSKKEMINATVSVPLSSAIAAYESDHSMPRGIRERISGEIERKKKDRFYYETTLDGLIKDWIVYDVGGRNAVEALDRLPGKKAELYRNARDLAVIIPMFGMFYDKGDRDEMSRPRLIEDTGVMYNPNIHNYFTLEGVDDVLNFVRGDRFWELVARQKQQLMLK